MTLDVGARLGSYEILDPLEAGSSTLVETVP
jgi:hypothetical protein